MFGESWGVESFRTLQPWGLVANKCFRKCCLSFLGIHYTSGARKGHVLFSLVVFLQKAAAWGTEVCSQGEFSADAHTCP